MLTFVDGLEGYYLRARYYETLETVDGIPVSATYDANDRLVTQGSVTYSYDDDLFDANRRFAQVVEE